MVALKHSIDKWMREAERERGMILSRLKALEECEDIGIIDEVDEQEGVLAKFMRRSIQIAARLQATKLSQTITRVKMEEGAKARLGMPAAVVDKVAQQTISDIIVGNKSSIAAGIWESDIVL